MEMIMTRTITWNNNKRSGKCLDHFSYIGGHNEHIRSLPAAQTMGPFPTFFWFNNTLSCIARIVHKVLYLYLTLCFLPTAHRTPFFHSFLGRWFVVCIIIITIFLSVILVVIVVVAARS